MTRPVDAVSYVRRTQAPGPTRRQRSAPAGGVAAAERSALGVTIVVE